MSRILPGDENALLHTHPYNFNSPPEKTDFGKEDPESHSLRNGLRNGALMNRGNEWTSFHDAITAQTTLSHPHQSQAYMLIYRKMEHSAVTANETPRDSTKVNQQLPTEQSKPSHKTHHSAEEAPLHPGPPIKIPEKNLPRQGRSDVGANLQPIPIHKEGPTTENLKVLHTLLNDRHIPQALETRGRVRVEGQQS